MATPASSSAVARATGSDAGQMRPQLSIADP
jgi:hypothetical protein